MAELTVEQAALLSNIFRIIIKQIATDDDKTKLAPGEMGINYSTGSLYVRNPTTGELFSPNSIENMQLILEKYNMVDGTLNADYVNSIKIYNSVTELSAESIGPDTVVSLMVNNSILISRVDYDSNIALGYPTESGVMTIYKNDNTCVQMTYTDLKTNTNFIGTYDTTLHQFLHWRINGLDTTRYAEVSVLTDNVAAITFNKLVKDLAYITIKPLISIDLSTTTFTLNGSANYVVANSSYTPVTSILNPNSQYHFIIDVYHMYLIQIIDNTSPLEQILDIINSRTVLTSDNSRVVLNMD